MTLIDEYLAAVRSALVFVPKARRADIVSELEDDIRSQVSEREETLGRTLAESEAEAILQRFGHPMLVAGRYRGGNGTLSIGRQLIGPELFPIYAFVSLLNVAVMITVFALLAIFDNALTAGAMVLHLLFNLTLIGAIFTAADASMRRSIRSGWSPREAAPGRTSSDSRASAALEIVASIVVLNIWARLPWLPRIGAHRDWLPSALWIDYHTTFYGLVIVVIATLIAANVIKLIQPRPTKLRLALSAGANLAIAVSVVVALIRNAPLGNVVFIAQSVDQWAAATVTWTLSIVALGALAQGVVDLVRLTRVRSSRTTPPAVTIAV